VKLIAILFLSLAVSASTPGINFMLAFGILAGVTLLEALARDLAARRQMPARSE
jgi:hypothetical protein